ncbi:hypothetical protein IAU60_003817 [Kwoniella sp. DSM 27419]
MAEHRAVRRYAAQHDLFNRLHSISADERFVKTVKDEWYDGRFDVVANQRCGTWYCDPSTSSKAYAYFKSTDGHMSHWDFNLRRSNLSFAKVAEERGGLILVDSTRRGKRMPDGLSKTVLIWCAVINSALALRRDTPADDDTWDTELYLPPQVVPPTERSQIEDRLDEWTEQLESSTLPLPDLTKPLRPFFIHPSTSYPPQIPPNPPYTPIICLSASRWVNSEEDEVPSVTRAGDRTVGFDYVPGGGDDDELWAQGLTPPVFHANKAALLAADRDDLPSLVDEVVLAGSVQQLDLSVEASTLFLVGVPSSTSKLALDIGIPICAQSTWIHKDTSATTLRVVEVDKHPKDSPYLLHCDDEYVLAVPSAKTNAKGYDLALTELTEVVGRLGRPAVMRPGSAEDVKLALEYQASKSNDTNKPILSTRRAPGPSDRKLVIPLVLAVLCSTTIADVGGPHGPMTKAAIADRLHSLVALWPDGNPPRAALKRVNEFLMSEGRKG